MQESFGWVLTLFVLNDPAFSPRGKNAQVAASCFSLIWRRWHDPLEWKRRESVFGLLMKCIVKYTHHQLSCRPKIFFVMQVRVRVPSALCRNYSLRSDRRCESKCMNRGVKLHGVVIDITFMHAHTCTHACTTFVVKTERRRTNVSAVFLFSLLSPMCLD